MLITAQSFVLQDRLTTDNLVFSVGFEASNKEYLFLCQLVVPTVIAVPPVNSYNAALGKLQCTANLNIAGLALRNGDKLRKIAAVIQSDMKPLVSR